MNMHLFTPIPFAPTNYHSPQMVEVERATITLLTRRKGALYNWQRFREQPGTPHPIPHQLSNP